MTLMRSTSRVGVYADVANMYRNGGQRMQYDALREFACRDHAEPVRLNAYVTYDVERAKRDPVYRQGANNFHSKLRDYGYKVIVKEIFWFRDESGNRVGKADANLDLAVDALLQSQNLDRVLIASGDVDFVNVVRAMQGRGVRVEVVGLDHTARSLREEADMFTSGYLIPNLVPIDNRHPKAKGWGEIGSRVRGVCYWYESDRGFGYMRFLRKIAPGLWLTDARHPDSPYDTAFFPAAHLPSEVRPSWLPSRDRVFEFTLAPSERGDGLQAADIELIGSSIRQRDRAAASSTDDRDYPAPRRADDAPRSGSGRTNRDHDDDEEDDDDLEIRELDIDDEYDDDEDDDDYDD
ncbi:MAG: NYN domain-containing protein [Acidobacteriota bacterium]